VSFYRELAPSRDLHALVACRWVRMVPEDSRSATTLVLPDGCVDLIWRDGELLVAGPDRAANPTRIHPGQMILGLRLRPGVAGAVLGMPASEILDARYPLREVLGGDAAQLAERIGEQGDEAAFELLEALVVSRMGEAQPDPLVLAVTRRLGFPGSRVEWLADALGISERQLRRRFHNGVGYGPKTLDRVLRFRRFVSEAQAVAAGERDLARMAADLGYADQSHLTRDCVRMSGLTPTRLARRWTAQV
jgi:AraC-like DNA-binding protein